MTNIGTAVINPLPTSQVATGFTASQVVNPAISFGTAVITPIGASVTPKRYVNVSGTAVPIS